MRIQEAAESEYLENRLRLTMAAIEANGGKIVVKRGLFWKALHYAVFALTFGGNRKFITNYYTTIGPWIGVPLDWKSRDTIEVIAVLEHENFHVSQCKRFGLGNVYLGILPFSFLYLLCLPAGLAYFRWRFEREAYAHGINVRIELERDHVKEYWRKRLVNSAVRQLTGPAYAWTWSFRKSVRAYFEAHVDKQK